MGYATYLGLDPDQDKDLLWIAKEGLKAPLPGSWKACRTATGEIYYFNFDTGQSMWEHPCDQDYKQRISQAKAEKQQALREKQEAEMLAAEIAAISSRTDRIGA